jgi:diguanylate cyclase (GGDEF)-like protein
MPPSSGVRPDLATRLRDHQRALESRLRKPDTHLTLLRAAHETIDPARIGDLVLEHVLTWLGGNRGAVMAADDGGATLIAGRGLTGTLPAVAEAIARWVLANGRGFASADVRRDPRVAAACGAAFAMPLRSRARTVGAVVILERSKASREPVLAARVADQLAVALSGPAVALDNALTLRRAESLSITDDLTQLYNSRYLNLVLRREAKRASRNGRPLSLLFVDLDGFKAVNDTHGHLYGSQALVEAAKVIRGSARETDVVARFGGDEFALVLPDTGSGGAAAVGDRVRERIAAHRFLADAGLSVKLTVSVGVATLPDAAASSEELVRAADTAMYGVKDSGKNGVLIARARPTAQ